MKSIIDMYYPFEEIVEAPIYLEKGHKKSVQLRKLPNTKYMGNINFQLFGNPKDLFNILIKDDKEKKWATYQLINKCPKHKQELSAILIKRLFKLVQRDDKSVGTKFSLKDYAMCLEAIEWVINADSNKNTH
jgi:hypothetical protein